MEKVDLKKIVEFDKKAAELKKLMADEAKDIEQEEKRMMERQKAIKALS